MSESEVAELVPLVRPFFDRIAQMRQEMNSGVNPNGGAGWDAESAVVQVGEEIKAVVKRKNDLRNAPVATLLRDDDPLLDDLRTFATWMLATGSSPAARALKYKRRDEDGEQDARFFRQVRQELKGGAGTTQRLVVYGICLGLGYSGADDERGQIVTQLRNDIWTRIAPLLRDPRVTAEVTTSGRDTKVNALFPDTYKVNRENLVVTPVRWTWVYVLCALAVASIVAAGIALFVSSRGLGRVLDDLKDSSTPANELKVTLPEPDPPAASPESPALKKEAQK